LLLGYYTDEGKLIYAGRVGTGMPEKVLKKRALNEQASTKAYAAKSGNFSVRLSSASSKSSSAMSSYGILGLSLTVQE
jgi:ATP-dependent DNA ligase